MDIGVCLYLVLLVGDLSCWCGESALTSVVQCDASVLNSVLSPSLDTGRSIDRKFSVLTWGPLLGHLRAASL